MARTKKDIVITGFSARFSQADDFAEFKRKLYAGEDFIPDDCARWPRGYMGLPERLGTIRDLSLFDAQFFGVLPKLAHVMDPQMRLLLETSYEAIVDAGYDPATLRGRRIGVFIGCCDSESDEAFNLDTEANDGYCLIGSSRTMFSNRLSYALDFHGPSFTVDTGCSSTMTALNEAVQALRSGQCDGAIVGGSMVALKPSTSLSFLRLGMLSPDGKCKSFDSRGVMFPSSLAQEQLLREVYAEAGLDTRQVVYLEAHGTGTQVGDSRELCAVTRVFSQPGRDKPLLLGAVKSNVGHGEAASGLSSIAKVILALETGTIAGNLHFTEANADFSALHNGSIEIIDKATPFPGGPVGINSFGIGGSNVHAIFEPYHGPHVDDIPRAKDIVPRLVLFAGRSRESLLCTLDRVETEGPYPDSAYAMLNQVGQPDVKQFPHRGFVVVPADGSKQETVKIVSQAPLEKRPVWFVFTGMGCQWMGMARQMMHFDIFSRSILKSDETLKQFNISLVDILTNNQEADYKMASVQASIAAVQIALVDMLGAMGVQPDGMLGHSAGEIGCSYADGCLTAEQTALCAYWRGSCIDMGHLPKGAMAAVGLTWEEAITRCRNGVVPVCHNAQDSVTVSGPAGAVAELVAELKAEGVFAREVESMNVAFHSDQMQIVAPAFREALQKVIPEPKERSKRWISTSLPQNRWSESIAKVCSAEYHVNNLLSPVLFHEALLHIPKDAIFVEIAPHCLLLETFLALNTSQPILRRVVGTHATCLGLMKRDADNMTFFLKSLGELHTLGVKLDLTPLYPSVPVPVPRGTPSIGHLVSWDHSQRWTVAQWDQFACSRHRPTVTAQMSDDVVDINLECNQHDAYLCGHQIDGRVIFPIAAYMLLAWKTLSKRCGKSYQEVPVVFNDFTLHRAVALPKTGSLQFLVNIMPSSGEFEVTEDGTLVASGRIYMADEGERIIDKDQKFPSAEATIYQLDAEDIYKEFRLRGYEYSGSFQSILKADLHEPCGQIKWEDNWVTFIDSLLQFYVFVDLQRTLKMVIKIESCRIDPHLHKQVLLVTGEEGMHVVYDHRVDTCRAGGVMIRGMNTTTLVRQAHEQAACLEKYRFVPYIDDVGAEIKRQGRLQEYINECSGVVSRILKTCGKDMTLFFEPTRGHCDFPKELLNKHLQNPAKNTSLLRVLTAIEKDAKRGSFCLVQAAENALATHKEDLNLDMLNTALLEEDPLREILEVVVENTNARMIRILELATDENSLLLTPFVCKLLPLVTGVVKTECTLIHPCSRNQTMQHLPEAVRKMSWEPASAMIKEVHDADLVISCIASSDVNVVETLLRKISAHCNERSFALISVRTALSPAEEFLRKMGHYLVITKTKETMMSLLTGNGFRIIAFRSNCSSALFLVRKVTTVSETTQQDSIRICDENFDWLETLKAKAYEYEKKPAGRRLWLIAESRGVSGIVGLMNCLLMEMGSRYIRCAFDASLTDSRYLMDFTASSPAFKELVEKDLVMNVYRNNQWGCFRHLTIRSVNKTTECAFLNVRPNADQHSLQWCESPIQYSSSRSSDGKLICRVYYAPLNTSDDAIATGKFPQVMFTGDTTTSGSLVGLEFSGRDPCGRRVMGLVPAKAISTTVAVDPDWLWEVPEDWSLEEASTVPAAYCIVYYALLGRGNMRRGESLLVLSGGGAAGQAAISVALSMGCTVFTTVDSEGEEEYLKARYPQLSRLNIVNSSKGSTKEHIFRETKGRGVNLVLSFESGKVHRGSIRCLAKHGRFLEISMFNLSSDYPFGKAMSSNSITIHGISLQTLHDDDPASTEEKHRVWQHVLEGIRCGAVRPLDTQRFRWDQAEEAFRFMGSKEHSRKVVLEVRPEESTRKKCLPSILTLKAAARTYFDREKSYVIVGGLGGMGLELADWMVGRGCRKLFLTSRSGVRTGYQRLCLKRCQHSGAQIIVCNSDISTEEGARKVIEGALNMGPVGGIFNLAVVLRNAMLESQTAESFKYVSKPKVDGTRHLDKVSRKLCPDLDHFVVFSSVSCGRGNAGQTNYGYANSAMERICERRVVDGLPGLAIQWGPVGEVGVLHREKGGDMDVGGYAPQKIRSCMNVMDQFLNQNQPVVSSLVRAGVIAKSENSLIRTSHLVDTIAQILGFKDPSALSMNMTLGELGMDSLVGVEVQRTLERDYDLPLSMSEIRQLTFSRLKEIRGVLIESLTTDKKLP